MGLPTNTQKPDYLHVFPSDKAYFDTRSSTEDQLRVTVADKSGKDYNVKDPQKVTTVVTGTPKKGGGA